MASKEFDTMRDECFAALTRYGISRVTVHFDGSGDSGQIEEITFESALSHPDSFLEDTPCPDEIEWAEKQYGKDITTLYDLCETMANHALDAHGMDWYNNDGGFGDIIMMPAEGVLHVDMNIRVMSEEPYPMDFGSKSLEEFQGPVTAEGN